MCHLVTILRTDGVQLDFTDWDRDIVVDGTTFKSAKTVGFSAERREGALRSGDQEFYGVIDGQYVKIHDLLGFRYRGATVTQRSVDARYPWIQTNRSVKRITSVKYSQTGWTATMEMLSQTLERPRGGRFNGVNSPICGYQLGGIYCKKDLSTWNTSGVRISSVETPRVSFFTYAASWKASYADDFYREGEFEFVWGPPVLSSTTTSSITAGATSLTDTSAAMTVDEHIGKAVRILSAANGYAYEYKSITSNTATTVSFGALSNSYPSGTNYDIVENSDLKGLVVPIAYYRNSDRRVSLFFPTPIDFVIGESGIVRPGCDGLHGTCKGKYDNLLNHGAIDDKAPTANDIIKTPEDN